VLNDPNRPTQYGPPQATGAPATANTVAAGVRVGAAAVPREGFLTASFVWMFLALLVSAGAAWFVMSNPATLSQVIDNWFILLIAQLGLVFGLSFLITRIPAIVALGAFFVYALLMGLTLGVIVAAYTATIDPLTGQMVFTDVSGVVTAFLGASAIFAGAALYGAVTKRDLTSLQGILFMGLLGLIVVMLVQVFFFPGSGWLNLAIGVVGVVIFTGLTAWDVQRIRNGQVAGINSESASVMGALALYLDFVNLFLFLLRIFGSNR
jgi:FtsH-binding integral membrane protein